MNIKKKLLALLLIAVMTMSMVMPGLAATKSGSSAPETKPANKTYVVRTGMDNNQQDHAGKVVVRSKVTNKTAVVNDVLHGAGKKPDSFVALTVARDINNKKVWINQIGTGSKGIFDSQKGRCVKSVTIGSPVKVTVAAKAFAGSNVNILRLKSQNIVIKPNAFNGTKKADARIYIIPPKKTAASITVSSGSFKGLNAKSVISVSASAMSVAEFNKLRTKLTKAGFKGKIVRK